MSESENGNYDIFKMVSCISNVSSITLDFIFRVTYFNLYCVIEYETLRYEPPRGKTNNVVSEQVQHKPTCTSTGKN